MNWFIIEDRNYAINILISYDQSEQNYDTECLTYLLNKHFLYTITD